MLNMLEKLIHILTCSGYATNEVKVPRISGRPHWNYVEVKNCNINGHCPSSDLSLIKRIYERGITFWRNADEVGDLLAR